MAGAIEGPAVLPAYAHIPACFYDLIQRPAGALTVVSQIQEQHVGPLGHGGKHAWVVVPDVLIGVFAVALQHLEKLIRPRLSLLRIGPNEGVHREDVHFVIMGSVAPGLYPVPKIIVVDDVIAANETRQIKGLGGGVDSHGVLSGPVVDHQGWDMPGVGNVCPDLIRDYQALVGLIYLHGLFQLPPLPDPAGWVVGRAEDGQMDVVFLQLLVHVLIVHAPDAIFIPFQRAVDGGSAQTLHIGAKSHIGGAVEQDFVSRRGERLDGTGDAAVDSVLIADIVPFESDKTVAPGLEIPTSLKEFGVPAEDLEGLVKAGMEVTRLLVNNMREVTPDDAREIYQQIL